MNDLVGRRKHWDNDDGDGDPGNRKRNQNILLITSDLTSIIALVCLFVFLIVMCGCQFMPKYSLKIENNK